MQGKHPARLRRYLAHFLTTMTPTATTHVSPTSHKVASFLRPFLPVP